MFQQSGRTGGNPKGIRANTKSTVKRRCRTDSSVNTDSKVTMDKLRNRNKHYITIQDIRKEIKEVRGTTMDSVL
jgi:hypothetical protein